jgi:hypothetical protein
LNELTCKIASGLIAVSTEWKNTIETIDGGQWDAKSPHHPRVTNSHQIKTCSHSPEVLRRNIIIGKLLDPSTPLFMGLQLLPLGSPCLHKHSKPTWVNGI